MWKECRRRVDGKGRGLDAMHPYVTSQHSLSVAIIQLVELALRTDVSRTQGQCLYAQRKCSISNMPHSCLSVYIQYILVNTYLL